MNKPPIEHYKIVDNYFCKVCDMPVSELDADSNALVQVWHSNGLIGNGGMHSYLCAIGDEAVIIANAYRHAGIDRGCDLINSSYKLWKTYWPDTNHKESDPDDFRNMFDSELNVIEAEFYDLDDIIVTKLYRIASREGFRHD